MPQCPPFRTCATCVKRTGQIVRRPAIWNRQGSELASYLPWSIMDSLGEANMNMHADLHASTCDDHRRADILIENNSHWQPGQCGKSPH